MSSSRESKSSFSATSVSILWSRVVAVAFSPSLEAAPYEEEMLIVKVPPGLEESV